MTFGYNQFTRFGRQKLSNNEKFLGTGYSPQYANTITGTGAGTTSATPGNGYTYQTYTASGTLTVTASTEVDILVIAGGGRGGDANLTPLVKGAGGGGGAGGVVYVPNFTLSAGTYTISIGAGAGAASSVRGTPSYILTGAGTTLVFARGGGNGADHTLGYQSATGGSGGGGGTFTPPTAVNADPLVEPGSAGTQPAIPQPGITTFISGGNRGGDGSSSIWPSYSVVAGGGGGGSDQVGSTASPANGAINEGGDGTFVPQFSGSIIGVPALNPYGQYYAGGGGGGSYSNAPLPSPRSCRGGLGGG